MFKIHIFILKFVLCLHIFFSQAANELFCIIDFKNIFRKLGFPILWLKCKTLHQNRDIYLELKKCLKCQNDV